jgi:hypothetical protein
MIISGISIGLARLDLAAARTEKCPADFAVDQTGHQLLQTVRTANGSAPEAYAHVHFQTARHSLARAGKCLRNMRIPFLHGKEHGVKARCDSFVSVMV